MKYNDYELVSLAHDKNEEAIEILYDKYRPLILKKSREVYNLLKNKGWELDDIVQECNIGFDEAIRNFNQDDRTLFYTFVNLCLDRQMLSLLNRNNGFKNRLLNDAVSLDFLDNTGEDKNILDYISSDFDLERELISSEEVKEFYSKLKEVLSDFEMDVFKYRVEGYSYGEIAKFLGKSVKSVDNAIQRIKGRIKRLKNDCL